MTISRPTLRFPGTRTAREEDDIVEEQGPPADGRRDRARRAPVDLLTRLGLITFVLFALGAIGSPLWGGSVLAATDELSIKTPYYESGLAGLVVQNTYMDDTIDAVIPDTLLFSDELRHGEVAAWNPYVLGGVPLGATPTLGVLNPLTLPYVLLPGWLAPGYVKLLEMVFSAALTFAFLRRLRLGRPAALLGGLLFSSSAFLVVWTNWPHTRTAAFIPAVFWAVERLIQERRARDAALVVLALGGMLAGGFPAVTAFTLYTAGPYLLVRTLAQYPGQWRRIAAVILAAAAALAGAVALLAVQLLPFAVNMSHALVSGRDQLASQHLDPGTLVTALAPFALGSVNRGNPPAWYLQVNLVESMAYVGAAGLVLLVVALATPWAARAFLPRGVWPFLVAALGTWLTVLYFEPAVTLVHHLPVFSANFVGRGRSVVGLLVAVLAAVGLEVLLRHRQPVQAAPAGRRNRPGHRLRIAYGVAVWLAFGCAGALILADARRGALRSHGGGVERQYRLDHLYGEVLVGAVFLVAAAAAAGALWWTAGRPGAARLRLAAAAALPVLAAVQALMFVGAYWPRVDRDTYFPVTATHQYLIDHLGHERFVGLGSAMGIGADSMLRLRALNGHAFTDRRWAETVDGLPGKQFAWPTQLTLPPTQEIATSPLLDRLAVRYVVTSPRAPRVFGTRHPVRADGPPVTLRPGVTSSTQLAQRGPLRAVTLTPKATVESGEPSAAIEVVLSDGTGRELAVSRRPISGMVADKPFDVPVAAEDVPAGTPLTAKVTVVGRGQPVRLGGAAAGTVAAGTVTPAADHLRLVRAWPAAVYERPAALPRIRWASSAAVSTDAASTIARITAGSVRPDEVLLDAPGPPADGRPADVEIVADDTDEIAVRVAAQGAGYLVVADAIQSQWRATVDGTPARLVPADHGLAAVAVPAGDHTVRLQYAAPYHHLGGLVSLLTAAVLAAVLVGGRARDRLRERRRLSSPPPRANRHGGTAEAGL